jgi:hypothetical protein
VGRSNSAQQESQLLTLCQSIKNTTAAPVGGLAVAGYNGAQMVEMVAVGTAGGQAVTFKFRGSFDGVNKYDVGYQQVDAVAAPARSVSAITLTPGNGTVRGVYQMLDAYPLLFVEPSANTLSGTGAGLTGTMFMEPI